MTLSILSNHFYSALWRRVNLWVGGGVEVVGLIVWFSLPLWPGLFSTCSSSSLPKRCSWSVCRNNIRRVTGLAEESFSSDLSSRCITSRGTVLLTGVLQWAISAPGLSYDRLHVSTLSSVFYLAWKLSFSFIVIFLGSIKKYYILKSVLLNRTEKRSFGIKRNSYLLKNVLILKRFMFSLRVFFFYRIQIWRRD